MAFGTTRIANVTLRVRIGKDESVHTLQNIVLKGLGSSEEGFSVEEVTEIVVGLALDQLAKLADAIVPQELLSSPSRTHTHPLVRYLKFCT